MSMLSVQVDSLRLMARLVRDYDYSEISRMLREAADTIEGLRDRLQTGGGERMKLYGVETWSDLDNIGESYIERELYRTREQAEKRALVCVMDDDDLGNYAQVVEFEVKE
mgnify:CR=1 FL=1